MSRVGKKPVPVPTGVTAKVDGQVVSVKGAKGELAFSVPEAVSVAFEGGQIKVDPRGESKRVGYKAAIAGKNLQLSLGFSHDVNYPVPTGVTITTPKPTEILVVGADKRQVGQVAAEIRAYRGPEPYKGKGVKYEGEYIFRKEGKKK